MGSEGNEAATERDGAEARGRWLAGERGWAGAVRGTAGLLSDEFAEVGAEATRGGGRRGSGRGLCAARDRRVAATSPGARGGGRSGADRGRARLRRSAPSRRRRGAGGEGIV